MDWQSVQETRRIANPSYEQLGMLFFYSALVFGNQ